MWNRRLGWKFWLLWFFSNSLIMAVGFTVLGMGEQANTPRRYFPTNSPSIASCLLVAIMLGGVQWLILRRYREDICDLWVVTNLIGFPLSACISLFLYNLYLFDFHTPSSSFAEDLWRLARYGIISGFVGGFVGGFVIGFIQGVGLEFAEWIPINAVAWAGAWATGLVLGQLADSIAVDIFHIPGSLSMELGSLGLGLGVVSSFITGSGLVWLSWRRQRSSRDDHSLHRIR